MIYEVRIASQSQYYDMILAEATWSAQLGRRMKSVRCADSETSRTTLRNIFLLKEERVLRTTLLAATHIVSSARPENNSPEFCTKTAKQSAEENHDKIFFLPSTLGKSDHRLQQGLIFLLCRLRERIRTPWT